MPSLYEDDTGAQEFFPPARQAPPPPDPGPAPAPYYPRQPSYQARAASAPPPPKPPSPLDGINQERLTQLQDLVNQWEQLVGFSATVSDSILAAMAKNNAISDIYDVAQYLKQNMGGAWGNMQQQPWAWYGLSAAEYNSKLSSFDSVWRDLTGQALGSNDGVGNLIDQAFKQSGGQMSSTQFQTWLLSQDSIKNTYGWLRYGLNFNQFQQQKLSWQTAFGGTLSDAEGVQQLQYDKAAQGPNMAIAVQPTFTQQERKQATVGISGSVAR